MRLRTQLLAAACVLAAGAGTLWLASTGSDASVRFVEQVTADPAAHVHGTYTLMGIPELPQVPVTGQNGTELVPNPDFANLTRTTTVWQRGGEVYYSTHTLGIRATVFGTAWWFRNETRHQPTDAQTAFPPVTAEWSLGSAGQAFPVAAFTDPEHQRVWAYYAKATEHPLQPKPSQFTGHLLERLPDGTPLPQGALIYQVDAYTAGCSSKFLPPELQQKYQAQNATA